MDGQLGVLVLLILPQPDNVDSPDGISFLFGKLIGLTRSLNSRSALSSIRAISFGFTPLQMK